MRFEFATSTRIIYGRGALADPSLKLIEYGTKAAVFTGSNPSRAAALYARLDEAGILYIQISVTDEPTVERAVAYTEQVRAAGCDFVIAFGGGSVLDTGKAISALLTNPGDPLEYLEVVGKGQPLHSPAAPMIAIPTTAGTGSEVTRNAVLAVPEKQVKVSLRSPMMLPRLALVDPSLTDDLPAEVTASTGMDALTQVIEPYTSNTPTPITDALALDGIRRAAHALRAVAANGHDQYARDEMALVSLYGGLCLANSKLGAVHGFAGTLGGMYGIAHGVICASLLPHVTRTNIAAMRARQPEHPALGRYADVARALTGRAEAVPEDAVPWLEETVHLLGIPKLVLRPKDYPTIIAQSQKGSSMKGNPLPLTDDELHAILIAVTA